MTHSSGCYTQRQIGMRSHRPTVSFLTFILVLLSVGMADAQTVVVKAARLIDGRGGPPLEPAMVRITGERIDEVGSSLTVPAGATLIDLGAATMLPGLIDLH